MLITFILKSLYLIQYGSLPTIQTWVSPCELDQKSQFDKAKSSFKNLSTVSIYIAIS